MRNELSLTTQVVVATYNPDLPLLEKNLRALANQFANILVVDDGSKDFTATLDIINQVSPKIEVRKTTKNMGIAHAFNVGLKEALQSHKEWLLTMDQDSVIPGNLSEEYQNILKANPNIGILGWNQRGHGKSDLIENDWFIISSGCLISARALKKGNGFDDKLFIDHVDTEVNLKLRSLGYRTIITKKVSLAHQLGTATDKKTIRGESYRAHSPVRIYYMTRNAIVLWRRYFFRQPLWASYLVLIGLKECLYLLVYQPDKLKNLRLLARASFDGIFNRLGKY